MSSVRVLHGALGLQMVDEQRNSLQQVLLRKLREDRKRASVTHLMLSKKPASSRVGGGSHLTSEDHDVLDGVRFKNRELVNCNDRERSREPAGDGHHQTQVVF